MKKTFLYLTVAALVAVGGACSASVTTNTSNTNAANKPSNTATVINTNTANNTTTNATNTANTNAANSATNSNSTAHNNGAAQDFKLDNETGVEIHHVFISPSDSNDWEEDILGKDTLPSGESVDIKFNRTEKAAKWDLKVEAKDGSNIVWEDLNLLEISQLTLHYKDGKATADMK